MNRIFKLLVMISSMIILDQMTKGYFQSNYKLGQSVPIIDGFFNFTYVQNRGAAFGFGATSGDWFRITFFKVLPVFVVLALIYIIWKERNEKTKAWISWAYGLIVAGAVGNLIDRIGLDYVVDFLDFYIGNSHYPAFNVADSCISTAFVMIVIDMIQEERRKKLETNTAENRSD